MRMDWMKMVWMLIRFYEFNVKTNNVISQNSKETEVLILMMLKHRNFEDFVKYTNVYMDYCDGKIEYQSDVLPYQLEDKKVNIRNMFEFFKKEIPLLLEEE